MEWEEWGGWRRRWEADYQKLGQEGSDCSSSLTFVKELCFIS